VSLPAKVVHNGPLCYPTLNKPPSGIASEGRFFGFRQSGYAKTKKNLSEQVLEVIHWNYEKFYWTFTFVAVLMAKRKRLQAVSCGALPVICR